MTTLAGRLVGCIQQEYPEWVRMAQMPKMFSDANYEVPGYAAVTLHVSGGGGEVSEELLTDGVVSFIRGFHRDQLQNNRHLLEAFLVIEEQEGRKCAISIFSCRNDVPLVDVQ
jgi:hypothetical protein